MKALYLISLKRKAAEVKAEAGIEKKEVEIKVSVEQARNKIVPEETTAVSTALNDREIKNLKKEGGQRVKVKFNVTTLNRNIFSVNTKKGWSTYP